MNGIIRKASINDADAMAELDRICFTLPWSRQAFLHELSNEAAFYIVTATAGKIIGYAGMWSIIDEGHITNLAVHPEHRKMGLGEMMLSEMIRISREDGILKHTLEVRASNEPAIGLYKKMGFKISGIRKEYYSDNMEDALILWRE